MPRARSRWKGKRQRFYARKAAKTMFRAAT
jgi:hypothetical protein